MQPKATERHQQILLNDLPVVLLSPCDKVALHVLRRPPRHFECLEAGIESTLTLLGSSDETVFGHTIVGLGCSDGPRIGRNGCAKAFSQGTPGP
jgi:hypothetical protein